MHDGANQVEALAAAGAQWLLGQAREVQGHLVWWAAPLNAEPDATLYSGGPGIVVTLLEAFRHFGEDRYAEAAIRSAAAIAATVETAGDPANCSLYFGVTGSAVALHAVDDVLGVPSLGRAADRILGAVRSSFDGERWGEQFELLGGNAGIALGAMAAGGLDLALLAVTPYLRTAAATAGGVQWEVRTGMAARFHHISHGTLGIVHALAAVGHATGRADLLDLALAGAADVVSRNEAGPEGFLVPHSDPQHRPDVIERYSLGGATARRAMPRRFDC